MAIKRIRYVAEGRHEEFAEADHATSLSDQSDFEAEASESCCVHCGDLLVWYEELCVPAALHSERIGAVALHIAPVASIFAYELGHQVLPITSSAPCVITWRGQLKERHPETGMVHRVPVYRLDDGYWDCYREEELQVA